MSAAERWKNLPSHVRSSLLRDLREMQEGDVEVDGDEWEVDEHALRVAIEVLEELES